MMDEESLADAPRPFRLTTKRVLLLIGLGALSISLLVALGGGWPAVAALTNADWRMLALAVVIHYSGFAVRGHRWQLLLRVMGHSFRYLIVTALLLSGWFASALLPGRAGDLLRVLALRAGVDDQPPVPVADGLGSIVLERVLDMLAILILGALFGFLVLRGQLPDWVLGAYAVAVVLLVMVLVALIVVPALLDRLRGWSANRWWQAALHFAVRFVASLRTLAEQPLVASIVVLESFYIWLCDALLLWLVVWSLGTLLPFGSVAFVALTVDIVAAVPLTPGGVGQIEAANGALLRLLALPAFNVAAAVLLVRVISYWSFLLFSGVVTFVAGFSALLHNSQPASGGHP
jgi:uncharacterized protein (TIRG00374 family)